MYVGMQAAGSVAGPFQFEAALSIAWVGDTAYALIDRSDQQVVVFDLDGREIARGARQGGGPGELQGATAVGTDDGRIVVADGPAFRITVFTTALDLVRTVQVPGMPYQVLSVAEDKVAIAWLVPGPGTGPTVGRVHFPEDRVEPIVDPFAADPELARPIALEGLGVQVPVQFLAVAGSSRGFVVGAPHVYHFARFTWDGTVVGTTARRDIEARAQSEEEVAELGDRMNEAFRRTGRSPPPQALKALQSVAAAPKPFFRTTGVALSEEGVLFVATELADDPGVTQMDMFSPDGQLVRSQLLPHHVRAMAVSGTRLLALVHRTDEPYVDQDAVELYSLSYERAVGTAGGPAAGSDQ